jgi:hypothetical protein
MKKLANGSIVAGLLCFGSANATIRYTEARIIEIETTDTQIFLFLEFLSDDAPPLGNGGSNSLPNRSYLTLANTAAEIENGI